MKKEIVFNDDIEEMLLRLGGLFKQYGIDFYMVGAVARDIHLSVIDGYTVKRKTKDIDIAIMLSDEEQFYQVREALLKDEDFSVHKTESIKFFYKNEIELDLLPFGDIEDSYGVIQLHKPRLFTIDMPGFSTLFPNVEVKKVGNIELNVCPIEGLIILKLIANDDNSSRTKDLVDIQHILDVYFDINQLEIWENYLDVMDLYDTTTTIFLQLVSARIVGRKMKMLLVDAVHISKRVSTILAKRVDPVWLAMYDGMYDS